MVFLGLTLYSRIMNTNPLSFLVQNNWIPCRPCRFHVPSALSLVQGFEINLYIFYILKWLGTQSKYLKIFFCQATSPNQNSPLWSFLWGLNLCFLLGDRSQDANFDKFLDCHIESYQSAGGPKLNKEAGGSFFGMKRGFKTTSKLGTNMLCRFWSVWSFCPKQENRWTGRAFTKAWSWKQFWSTLFWQWLVHMAQRETEGYKFGSNI